MKKRLLSTFIVIVLLFSFCSVSFASTDEGNAGIVPYETDVVSYAIDRTSATTATVSINVSFSQRVDQYSVVVFLQKYVNGEWVLDTTNDDYIYFNNGLNSYSFLFTKKYSDLKRGVTYRIRCVSKDYIGSTSHISTTYSPSF